MSRLPILCYHNIGRAPATSRFSLLYVSPEALERQLWTLGRLGFRGVTISEGVRELERGGTGGLVAAGMEIGSHSCSHPRLQELDAAALRRETADSRATLQKAFAVPIDHFCYPYGLCTPPIEEEVQRCGYRSAVSLYPGPAHPGDRLFHLPRMLVNGDHGWLRFLVKVGAPYEYLVSWRWRA